MPNAGATPSSPGLVALIGSVTLSLPLVLLQRNLLQVSFQALFAVLMSSSTTVMVPSR